MEKVGPTSKEFHQEFQMFSRVKRMMGGKVRSDLCNCRYLPAAENAVLKFFPTLDKKTKAKNYYSQSYNDEYYRLFPYYVPVNCILKQNILQSPGIGKRIIFERSPFIYEGIEQQDCQKINITFITQNKSYDYLVFSGNKFHKLEELLKKAKAFNIKKVILSNMLIIDSAEQKEMLHLFSLSGLYPDIIIQDKNGDTILHSVHGKTTLFETIPRIISKEKIRIPKSLLMVRNEEGKTPLEQAIEQNNLLWAEFLLKNDADPNSQNKDGITLLYDAIRKSNGKALNVLLQYNANVNERNHKDGETPLFAFSNLFFNTSNTIKRIELIRNQYGANIDIQNNNGQTPLHDAVLKDNAYFENARALAMEQGMTEERVFRDLDSAWEIFLSLYLLNLGARIDIKDNEGNTPLDLARSIKTRFGQLLAAKIELHQANSMKKSLLAHLKFSFYRHPRQTLATAAFLGTIFFWLIKKYLKRRLAK